MPDPNGSSMQLDIDFTDANSNDNHLVGAMRILHHQEQKMLSAQQSIMMVMVNLLYGDCDDMLIQNETLDIDEDGFTTCGVINTDGSRGNVDCDDSDPLSLLKISIKMVLQHVDWSILKSAYKKASEFLIQMEILKTLIAAIQMQL